MSKRSKKSVHKNSNINPTSIYQNTPNSIIENHLITLIKQLSNTTMGRAMLIVGILGVFFAYKQFIAINTQAQAALEANKILQKQFEFTENQATLANQSVVSNNEQPKLIDSNQIKSNLINQEDTMPNLDIAINDSEMDAFIIPTEQQPISLNNKKEYIAVVHLDISNSSNIPVTITGMDVTFKDANVLASKTLIHADKLTIITDRPSLKIDEYPNIFILQPHDSMHKYVVFPTDYYPSSEMVSADLIIKTNRNKQILYTFNIHKMPGLVDDPNKAPIKFDLDRNSTNKKDRISFFP